MGLQRDPDEARTSVRASVRTAETFRHNRRRFNYTDTELFISGVSAQTRTLWPGRGPSTHPRCVDRRPAPFEEAARKASISRGSKDVAVIDRSVVSLQQNRSGRRFIAVDRPASDAVNKLSVDHFPAIEDDRHAVSDDRCVERIPLARGFDRVDRGAI